MNLNTDKNAGNKNAHKKRQVVNFQYRDFSNFFKYNKRLKLFSGIAISLILFLYCVDGHYSFTSSGRVTLK